MWAMPQKDILAFIDVYKRQDVALLVDGVTKLEQTDFSSEQGNKTLDRCV